MTLRSTLIATGLGRAMSLPAQALDITTMSEAERAAFRAEIRAYLLENPEVIMEAVAVLEQREQDTQVELDRDLIEANRDAIFADGHSWSGGNPEGDITLVEFMDYRCGYCRRAFTEVEELIAQDGNIRLVLKEFPILGEESELAARFAIATQQIEGDDAYKSIHDALMTLTGPINETTLGRLAGTLGIAPEPILAHMESDAVSDVITQNRRLAARLQINGTPSFVMNDEMLRGYLPLDAMQSLAETLRSQ